MTAPDSFRVPVWCCAGYPVVVLVLLVLDCRDKLVHVEDDIVIGLGNILDTVAVDVGPDIPRQDLVAKLPRSSTLYTLHCILYSKKRL